MQYLHLKRYFDLKFMHRHELNKKSLATHWCDLNKRAKIHLKNPDNYGF